MIYELSFFMSGIYIMYLKFLISTISHTLLSMALHSLFKKTKTNKQKVIYYMFELRIKFTLL